MASRLALAPGLGQSLVHRAQGAPQDGQVAAALAVGVGVGEEAALGVLTGAAQRLHDRVIGERGALLAQVAFLGQRGAELAEGPALDQTDRALGLVAARELVQQTPRGDAGFQLVAAGLDLARTTRESKPGVQPHRRDIHACRPHGLRDVTRQGAGFDGEIDHGRRQRHRPMQPPQRAARDGEHGHHQDETEGQEQAPHGWTGTFRGNNEGSGERQRP